jgi:hypothetical protein
MKTSPMKAYTISKTLVNTQILFAENFDLYRRREKSYEQRVEEAKKEIADTIKKFGGLGFYLNF